MRFRVTPEELARQKLVEVGFHPVEIISVKEGMDKGKNGPAAGLLTIQARVFAGKEENKGAVLTTNFSEKAQGMIKNFAEAITGQPFEANKDYDFTEKNLKGRKMEWYVERGSYNGKPNNNVVDYRALEGAAQSTAAVAGT